MTICDKIAVGTHAALALFLHRKKPVMISWEITRRCNLKCPYCESATGAPPDLPSSDVKKIAGILTGAKTRFVHFTGGEPLVREDLEDILAACKNAGMITSLATNGILLSERSGALRWLDSVTISIDGEEAIHDSIRGQGSFAKAIQACELTKKSGRELTISCVISRANLRSLGFIAGLARGLNARALFQPATPMLLFSQRPNPLHPDIAQCCQAIEELEALRKNYRCISNSTKGLIRLKTPGGRGKIECASGKVLFSIDNRGCLCACLRTGAGKEKDLLLEKGLADCLKNCDQPQCGYCSMAARIELNLALGLQGKR